MSKNEEFTDVQLRERREAALAALQPRARALALAVDGGKPAQTAARELGISTNPQTLSRMKKRISLAVTLLREERRRKNIESADDAARWFDRMAEEARRAGDRGTAVRAKREASLLRAHYPEMRMRLEVSTSTSDVTPDEMEALARLRHEVRRLPPAVDVTPLPTGSSYASGGNVTDVAVCSPFRATAPEPGILASSLDSIEAPDAA